MRSFALARSLEDNYPGIYQDMAQTIGDDATAKLVEQYGGTRLYIPYKLNPEHPLCQLLGHETSQQLSSEYGGMTVEIPRAIMLQIRKRNELIMADSAAGMSQSKLARKYRLTERTIRKIINS